MAKAHEVTYVSRCDPDSRRPGRTDPAAVVPIRPGIPRPGPLNPLSRFAEVLASLRAQAAPVDSPQSFVAACPSPLHPPHHPT